VVALLVAGSVGLLAAILGTPILIRSLHARGIGQQIREDGPQGHVTKAGTPTMGGITLLGAAAIGYAASHITTGAVFTSAGLLVMLVLLGSGFVGLLDDWIKVSHQRSLGLNKTAKTVGLLVVALTFAALSVHQAGVRTDISFTRPLDVTLPEWAYIAWVVLIIMGTANAVNLADARIFMGDTGSLAIGAGLAALALTTNTQLLLPLVGGLYVMITLSVMIQIFAFRVFGRRVFRMAPLHHHFELIGWPETTVIVRFWILAVICAAIAVGLFYADFLSLGIT